MGRIRCRSLCKLLYKGMGSASDGTRAWAMLMAWQSTPHSLFVLDKKRTGRGRSKRKNRHGGSVRASAYLRPPAGEGWPYLAAALMKREALGESLGPGRYRIPPASLSAGAGLAVNAGRRGRRPLRDGMRGRPVCLPGRRVLVTPVGADAHIRPPCQIPIYHQAKRKRMKKDRPFNNHPEVSAGPAHAGAERSECPSPVRAGRRLPCFCQHRFGRPPF